MKNFFLFITLYTIISCIDRQESTYDVIDVSLGNGGSSKKNDTTCQEDE